MKYLLIMHMNPKIWESLTEAEPEEARTYYARRPRNGEHS